MSFRTCDRWRAARSLHLHSVMVVSYGGQLWRLKARNYAMIFMGITYRIMIPELGEVLTMQKEGGSIHDRFAAAFFFCQST